MYVSLSIYIYIYIAIRGGRPRGRRSGGPVVLRAGAKRVITKRVIAKRVITKLYLGCYPMFI